MSAKISRTPIGGRVDYLGNLLDALAGFDPDTPITALDIVYVLENGEGRLELTTQPPRPRGAVAAVERALSVVAEAAREMHGGLDGYSYADYSWDDERTGRDDIVEASYDKHHRGDVDYHSLELPWDWIEREMAGDGSWRKDAAEHYESMRTEKAAKVAARKAELVEQEERRARAQFEALRKRFEGTES